METISATAVQDAAHHLIVQIQTGNSHVAFEELYDEDVVMIEADGSTRSRKESSIAANCKPGRPIGKQRGTP